MNPYSSNLYGKIGSETPEIEQKGFKKEWKIHSLNSLQGPKSTDLFSFLVLSLVFLNQFLHIRWQINIKTIKYIKRKNFSREGLL